MPLREETQLDPSLTSLAWNGTEHGIAWQQDNAEPEVSDLRLSLLTADGVLAGSSRLVGSGVHLGDHHTSVAALDDGWVSSLQTADRDSVLMLQRLKTCE